MRKTVKWGGAALTVLLLVVWIGSCWLSVRYVHPGSSWDARWWTAMQVRSGRAQHLQTPPSFLQTDPGMSTIKTEPHTLEMRFEHSSGPRLRYWYVPLWPAALLSLLATAAAWRADATYLRRVRVGLCPACGYDRVGLAVGAVCPECGKQPEAR